MFWFWIFVGPALALAALSLRGERRRAEYIATRMAELDEPPPAPLPPVALIVRPGTPPETLAALAAQDYPDYEITAALETARPGARIVVRGPMAGVVSKRWLRALILPLLEPGTEASAGFRWYAPEPPAFWPLMRSVWNGVIAGRLGPGLSDFAWPGANAQRLPAKGHPIKSAFAPGAAVADTSPATCGQFLRQAAGEMSFARRRYPRLWLGALLAHVVYCGAMLAAAIASYRGYRGAEWALVAQFGLGMLKGANRVTFAKAALPEYKSWFDRYGWTHILWVPLATWVWLVVLALSIFAEPRRE